ncbi:hypothetical protein ZEAMMB73_Zm00001d042469 [Zea mays]|nr:hypothetical protein ZEAMMB73_Zm00001d042469 [Zea mays]
MAAALGAVLRRLHTAAAQPPRLTKFALHPPKFVSLRFPDDQRFLLPHIRRSCLPQVEIEFADGSSFHLSAEFLRVYSPAADSKIRSVGGEKVIFGRRHVGIMSAESVGNYGVR